MQESVCRRTVTVTLPDGLHLRPISLIARLARRYACDVKLYKEQHFVDAKNVLEALTINAPCDTVLVLEATGDGADEAVAAIGRLFETDFEDPDSGGS